MIKSTRKKGINNNDSAQKVEQRIVLILILQAYGQARLLSPMAHFNQNQAFRLVLSALSKDFKSWVLITSLASSHPLRPIPAPSRKKPACPENAPKSFWFNVYRGFLYMTRGFRIPWSLSRRFDTQLTIKISITCGGSLLFILTIRILKSENKYEHLEQMDYRNSCKRWNVCISDCRPCASQHTK